MKLITFLVLTSLVGCSTGKGSKEVETKKSTSDSISSSFKKEKVLATNEVKDFYTDQPKSLNPALQDETLDRYSMEEIELLADTKDPLIEIAIRCSKKDYDKAFAVGDKVFNRYQKIPAYWNLVANCHLNKGSKRKALLFYNKALEISPGYVPVLNNIGVLYTRQGEDQKALVAFEKANKQSRFAKTPRYNLARLYLSYGVVDAALPLFQGLLNESSGDVDLINAVASCYYLKSDYQQSLLYYNRISPSLLNRPEIGLNYAVTLFKTGKKKEAQNIYSDIAKPKTKLLLEYYTTIGNQLGVQE